MKNRLVLLSLAFVLAVAAWAMTPAQRIGRLRSASLLMIEREGKDPLRVYSKPDVRPLVNLFKVDSGAVRGYEGGKTFYNLSFYRSEGSKPLEVLWVKSSGVWGFKGSPEGYGRNRDIVTWLEKAESR
ncbi:MAG: hypothetical protein H0W86_01105 [Armatimonadetes bacterium]|nr:hypothetical protein [Armatimonadota bacterium]